MKVMCAVRNLEMCSVIYANEDGNNDDNGNNRSQRERHPAQLKQRGLKLGLLMVRPRIHMRTALNSGQTHQCFAVHGGENRVLDSRPTAGPGT